MAARRVAAHLLEIRIVNAAARRNVELRVEEARRRVAARELFERRDAGRFLIDAQRCALLGVCRRLKRRVHSFNDERGGCQLERGLVDERRLMLTHAIGERNVQCVAVARAALRMKKTRADQRRVGRRIS